MTRPKHPRPDKNNNIVRDALVDLSGSFVRVDDSRLRYIGRVEGEIVTALKIADLPGQTDWIVLTQSGRYQAIEVKQPGNEADLTDGERDWIESTNLIVTSSIERVKWAIRELVKGN